MARRNDIDWEAIEADYRCNRATGKQLAQAHGIAYSSLRTKAKQGNWQRDQTQAVEQGTKVAMLEAAKANAKKRGLIPASPEAVESAVQAAIDVRVLVLTRHQNSASDMIDSVMDMHAELVDAGKNRKEIAELAEMVRENDPLAAAEIRKFVALPGRALTLKSLSDSLSKLINEERRAHGIKDEEDTKKDTEKLEDVLLKINASLKD